MSRLDPGPEAHADEPHAVGGLSRQLSWLRAGVLGANDGIVSVAAVVIGVAGAGAGTRALETAGLAALVGGALSMALGEFLAVVLLPASVRVPLTFVAVLLALALTGYLSSRVNDTPRLRPTVRLVAGVAVALVATFAIGSAVGALIG